MNSFLLLQHNRVIVGSYGQCRDFGNSRFRHVLSLRCAMLVGVKRKMKEMNKELIHYEV